jgi:F-type H+-transporting ATPase subunit gamma
VKREIELRRRLRTLEALGEAVGAMKSLSAHYFRDVRKAIAPAHTYRDGVERILAWSGATLAAGTEGAGVLVVGAELGLCGSYNAQVVEAATAHRESLPPGPTFCVGHRAATLLARRGNAVARTYSAPTSIGGITALLLELAEDLLTTYANERLSSFDIISSRFAGIGSARPTTLRLLPMEARPVRQPRPARYVRSEAFTFAAIRESLYITLYDLLLDALASEHGARLLATQSAERWLDERTTRLRRHLAATRREASTQEMIEIAAGARARGGGSNGRGEERWR